MAVINGIDGKCDNILTAVSSGGSSSEDIADIKSVVNNIYAEVSSTMSHITVSIVDYNGNDYINSSRIYVVDVSKDREISANQNGEYLIAKGSKYKITAFPNSHIPYAVNVASFDGIAVANTFHVSLVFDRMPEYVDLGNGIKWATGNLTKDANGVYSIADQVEYGAYFSWGNIDGHYVPGQDDSYNFASSYNSTNGSGLASDISSGDPTYDAARARLGGSWRMPTKSEVSWLIHNCTWNYKKFGNTDYSGVAGNEVVGTNGNKIFLPCTGMYNGTNNSSASNIGYYWSTGYGNSQNAAYLVSSNSAAIQNGYRYYGCSIRPVQ